MHGVDVRWMLSGSRTLMDAQLAAWGLAEPHQRERGGKVMSRGWLVNGSVGFDHPSPEIWHVRKGGWIFARGAL
jgi:hypothetical protein